MIKVNIDEQSGFCFGVQKTIEIAEDILRTGESLYCLGDIVHNEEEINRLKTLGLITIDYEEFSKLSNTKVLLRSHGEPPLTYKIAKERNIELIEGTCPIVLNLQRKIKKSFNEIESLNGQIVIYGKESHPEVISLKGQNPNSSIVISDISDLSKINHLAPVRIFSQTTQNSKKYKEVSTELEKLIKLNNPNPDYISANTICGAVSNRNISLSDFSKENDVIIFVGGKNSSNGKMLFEHCKSINVNSFYVSSKSDLRKNWLINQKSIGVCGATSTPRWLMNEIANKIEEWEKHSTVD